MKLNHTHFKHSAILGLSALALSVSVIFADPSADKPAIDIENKDPFTPAEAGVVKETQENITRVGTSTFTIDSTSLPAHGAFHGSTPLIGETGGTTAEMLDTQARILFARGEHAKAIKVQKQAVEKASENVNQFTKMLNLYMGNPNNENDDVSLNLIEHKLRTIIIPQVDFQDLGVEECLDFIRERITELDQDELDPQLKGFNIILIKRTSPRAFVSELFSEPFSEASWGGVKISDMPQEPKLKPVTLKLRNIPVGELLKYICRSAGLQMKVETHAVVLEPMIP